MTNICKFSSNESVKENNPFKMEKLVLGYFSPSLDILGVKCNLLGNILTFVWLALTITVTSVWMTQKERLLWKCTQSSKEHINKQRELWSGTGHFIREKQVIRHIACNQTEAVFRQRTYNHTQDIYNIGRHRTYTQNKY